MDEFDIAVKNYKRIKDLTYEKAIRLAEAILGRISQDSRDLIQAAPITGKKRLKNEIERLREVYSSDYYNILSMGHGDDALAEFNDRLVSHGIAL